MKSSLRRVLPTFPRLVHMEMNQPRALSGQSTAGLQWGLPTHPILGAQLMKRLKVDRGRD